MTGISGYWLDWVARPGSDVHLHLSGKGAAVASLHPTHGNDIGPAIDQLTWTGNLEPRTIERGSSTTVGVALADDVDWSFSVWLRLDSAPTCTTRLALLSMIDGTLIHLIADSTGITVVDRSVRLRISLSVGAWSHVLINQSGSSRCVRATVDGSSAEASWKPDRSVAPAAITFGNTGMPATAHVRFCDAQIQTPTASIALLDSPSKRHVERNNPTWGMSDRHGAHTAVRFHPDDIGDVQWPATLSFSLPDDLDPGVYVAVCTNGDSSAAITLFVQPRTPRHRIAVLLSTWTYLAYANYRQASEHRVFGDYSKITHRTIALSDVDHILADDVEPGWSLYDRYHDGTAVYQASRRRPLLDVVPGYRWWMTGSTRHLSTDLELLAWLADHDIGVDIVTDDTLYRSAPSALSDYDVIITSSHPEYVSTNIIDALAEFTNTGGHLLYLGGNGFYWVTEPPASEPTATIEIRRGTGWSGADPDDTHLSTGARAGRWADVGRPPNQLTGVGFVAQGWGPAAGYTQLDTVTTTEVGRDLFARVDPTETIGGFGTSLGGAAGDEIDAAATGRGTPATTIRLASSEHRHTDHLMHEDAAAPKRADITYTPTAGNGSVFAVGSMNWITSLADPTPDNNVATITLNAIHRATRRASR